MDYLTITNLLQAQDIECYIETNDYNKRYLTNFSGTTCEVIVSIDGIYFITDGRYETQVKAELYDGINILITNPQQSAYQMLLSVVNKYQKVGINNTTNYLQINKLQQDISNLKVCNDLITPLRMIKTPDEIATIKKAIAISQQSFKQTIAQLKPGMSEREIKALLEYYQICNGADDYAFQSIIASGINSCKPHADFSDKIIANDDIITIDWGCYYHGYCSDMTRTFFMSDKRDPRLEQLYDLVKACHDLQIKHLKPGVRCCDIDKIGRDFFEEHGVLAYFKHGTGHGIGLEIHECPLINPHDQTILQPGMIVTIEPGLYVDGLGGIRIEDDVLITKNGYEVLTTLPIDKAIKNN